MKKRAASTSRARAGARPDGIDAYLDALGAERRAPLDALRATLRAIVPGATECISYGMPAFRVERGVVAGFLATSKGYSFFPFSGTTLATVASALGDRSRTKSALHFTAEAPLPKSLVRKLVAARLAELRGS